MIPKRTVAQMQYARVVKDNAPDEVVADALALYTAARLKELILAALAKSPIDPDDAAELAALLLVPDQTDAEHAAELEAVLDGGRTK